MAKYKIPINAWREILTRIFEGFEVEYNVTPDWLINPRTNRKLKLDLLYPQIGVAVRFQGLKGKERKGPLTLKEKLELRKRDETRHKVCEDHSVSLAGLDLTANEPDKVFAELETAMSKASRRLARDKSYLMAQKMPLVEKLSYARSKAGQFARDIKSNRDLKLYNELWIDRQYREADAAAAQAATAKKPSAAIPQFTEGMLVEHTHFGPGLVRAVTASGDDSLVTIDFGDQGEKIFMASLLADKIQTE